MIFNDSPSICMYSFFIPLFSDTGAMSLFGPENNSFLQNDEVFSSYKGTTRMIYAQGWPYVVIPFYVLCFFLCSHSTLKPSCHLVFFIEKNGREKGPDCNLR